MNRTSRFVILHPWTIILITLAITAAFGAVLFTRGIEFNGSPETLAREDDALRFFREARQTFGDDRIIIVALTTDDAFTPRFLRKLDDLTGLLGAIDGVEEAQSLTNINAIRGENRNITIERLIPRKAFDDSADSQELQRLKLEIVLDPLYARHFVSSDGRSASINVFLKSANEAGIRATAEEIERVARREALPDELMLAGVPIIEARGVRQMIVDFSVLSPIAAALCFVVFLLAFRTFWGAVLPMAALTIGLVWTIGLMSLSGKPITLTTLAMPTVLMAVGGSYLFHILNQHRVSMASLNSGASVSEIRRSWHDGLKFILPAVLVSATTTMAGFGALASSTVPTVRDMGIFNAAGVLAMLLLSIGFVPACLSILKADALGRATANGRDYAIWLNRALTHANALVLSRRRSVITTSIAFTLFVGIGVLWLEVNTDYLRLFPEHSETVQSAQKLHERLAGSASVQVVLSGAPGSVLDNKFLGAVREFEAFCRSQPGVDAAISVADIADRFDALAGNTGAQGGSSGPNDYRKYLAEAESVYRLVDRKLSRASIILRTDIYGSGRLRDLINSIDTWAGRNLPEGITHQATGSVVVLNGAADAVAQSQASSLLLALVAVYLMMVALFRSFATGFLALLPNLLPIVGFFGYLGWTRTPLDITTSLIACAVLGLAVDNAVHMIRRYRQSTAERGGSSPEDQGWSMWLTMLRTGKPMVLANLMLIAAFLIFVLSSFVPVRLGGVLWALTIFGCLIADLVFLPALMKTRLFSSSALGKELKAGGGRIEDERASVAESRMLQGDISAGADSSASRYRE
jgi:predicted RND superfamily exporter protein